MCESKILSCLPQKSMWNIVIRFKCDYFINICITLFPVRTTMQQKKDNNLVFFCHNCPMTINKEGRVKIHNNNRNIVQNVY